MSDSAPAVRPPIRPLPAQGKIIKDAILSPDAPTAPLIEVMDLYWAPLNLYVTLTAPNAAYATPDHVSLQICPMRNASLFFFWNVPPPRPERAAQGGMRRIIAVVSCQYNRFEAFEARLVVGGRMVSIAGFERKFGADRLIGAKAPQSASPRVFPVLITGTPKSGTTWLESIVDMRADVLVLHEGNTLNTVDHRATRAGFEARLGDFQRRSYIGWRPAYPTAEELAMFTQISVARNLFELLGSTFGFRIVVDRTPSTSEAYHFLIKFWRECRYVHIVRHPLDVFVSRLFHEAALGRGKTPEASRLEPEALAWLVQRVEALGDGAVRPGDLLDDEMLRSGVFDVLFMQWLLDQKKLLEVLPYAGERFLVLRYEEVSADFDAQVRRVLGFIGVREVSEAELAAIHAATAFDAMSGGRRTGQEDRRSFFRSGQIGGWRQYLSHGQAVGLWARVAEVAGEFGYEGPE